MNRRIIYILCVLLGFIIFSGCQKDARTLHIGSKDFTEQLILGEMLAQLAEHAHIRVQRSIPYGDTFLCSEALKKGDLDIYVEYNGTGLTLLGQPPISDGDQAFTRVKTLFEPLGLIWSDRLGFANNFELVMRKDRAIAMDIQSISDLARFPSQVRFVSPEEWIERPLDGLAALQRRYGLDINARVKESKEKLYHDLLTNRADVAVGYSTDGHIEDYGLMVLKDDLRFFPVYEAAPLVRKDSLERFPGLSKILKKLSGTIDTDTMRVMNRAVELEGNSTAAVANEFLIKKGLLPETAKLPGATARDLLLAAGELDDLSGAAGKALRATRNAFPRRRVKIVRVPDAKKMVLSDRARIALLGAEAFYTVKGNGLPERDNRLEALGVVGYRMVHILASKNGPIKRLDMMKKIGVGPLDGTSHTSAAIIMNGLGMTGKIEIIPGSLDAQAEMVQKKKIDGMLLMVEPGNRQVADLLNGKGFKLISIEGWQKGNAVMRFPFFRLSRIAAKTYPGLADVIETVSAQTVLAGPSPKNDSGTGNAGPVAVAATGQAIADSVVLKLNQALGMEEKIDPTIPSADVLRPKKEAKEKKFQTDYFISGANALVLLAVVYLLYLFFAEEKRSRRRES